MLADENESVNGIDRQAEWQFYNRRDERLRLQLLSSLLRRCFIRKVDGSSIHSVEFPMTGFLWLEIESLVFYDYSPLVVIENDLFTFVIYTILLSWLFINHEGMRNHCRLPSDQVKVKRRGNVIYYIGMASWDLSS